MAKQINSPFPGLTYVFYLKPISILVFKWEHDENAKKESKNITTGKNTWVSASVSASVSVTMEVVNYSAWLLFVAEGIDSHFRSLISHLFTDGFASFLLCICKIWCWFWFFKFKSRAIFHFSCTSGFTHFFHLVISPKLKNRFSSFLVCNFKISC